MKRPTVLCVDDDPGIRELYETLLSSRGYEVLLAPGANEALQLYHSKTIDAVISDYEMPGMNGVELAAELKRKDPQLPVIMISGSPPVPAEVCHVVDAALAKDVPLEQIVSQIEALLAARYSRGAVAD
jgi:DNA-binding NtrC family response regulator